MDAVDILTFAVEAAQAIRSSGDPEGVIAGAYTLLGRVAPRDGEESIAVRIARLIDSAGERRREVLDHLRRSSRGPYLNRIGAWSEGPGEEVEPDEPDPEAVRLQEYAESPEGEAEAVPMFPAAMGPFAIGERAMVAHFGGRTVIERDGRRMSPEEAGEPQEGDSDSLEEDDLPETVRGLIDYPIGAPVLFDIQTGPAPWSLWEIFCAFADAYARIYEQPGRHGVWGHDIGDLWIEGLYYYPSERLIFPMIGS